MEYEPPVHKRKTEDLMNIIETCEDWQPEVVEMARIELTKRGISLDKLEIKRKSRIRSRINYVRRSTFIKSNATYSTTEKILIVLVGPIVAMIFEDFSMFHSGEGFKRKNRQGTFYFLLGIGMWGIILYISLMN